MYIRTYSSITCEQNDYLSINGYQKLKKQVNLKNCKFQKRNRDRKTYTIHHSHCDYEKVPTQDEHIIKNRSQGLLYIGQKLILKHLLSLF